MCSFRITIAGKVLWPIAHWLLLRSLWFRRPTLLPLCSHNKTQPHLRRALEVMCLCPEEGLRKIYPTTRRPHSVSQEGQSWDVNNRIVGREKGDLGWIPLILSPPALVTNPWSADSNTLRLCECRLLQLSSPMPSSRSRFLICLVKCHCTKMLSTEWFKPFTSRSFDSWRLRSASKVRSRGNGRLFEAGSWVPFLKNG